MLQKHKGILIAAGVFFVLVGTIVGAVWVFTSESQVDKVRRLQKEMFAEEAKKLPNEQKKENWKQLRAETDKLSPKERNDLFADAMKKKAEELDKFFKLPPEKQLEEIDKKIDQMEEFRKKLESGDFAGFGGFGGKGRRGSGPGGAALAANPGANPGGGQGFQGKGPGGWGGKARSQEERDMFRKNMLDATTPQFRAQMGEYRRQLGNRMQQRGISAPNWGRGAR